MPLYRKLVDLGKVTKMCYAVNGGAQGQGNDKARLIVDVSPEELGRKMPELITLEQGTHVVACELAPNSDGQVERWPMMAGSGRMPGLGRLRFSLLSPGLSRQSFGVDSPMREWLAGMFSCSVEEVRPQFLSEDKGWKDAAFDLAVPETDDGKKVRATLIRASRGGWFVPEQGEEYGQYNDVEAPKILFAPDRVQLAQLEGAKPYVQDAATLSSEQSEQLGELSRMMGGLAEGAAKDRAAAAPASTQLPPPPPLPNNAYHPPKPTKQPWSTTAPSLPILQCTPTAPPSKAAISNLPLTSRLALPQPTPHTLCLSTRTSAARKRHTS